MADPAPPRRRFQFRLRTLMIAVTLLAVACGYVGWLGTKVRNRKAWIETNTAMYSIKGVYAVRDGVVNVRMRIYPVSRGVIDDGLEFYRLNLGSDEDSPGWLRSLLGDEPIEMICIKENASTTEIQSVVALFPEAQVFATRRKQPDPPRSRLNRAAL
jgi:hypothetical protein